MFIASQTHLYNSGMGWPNYKGDFSWQFLLDYIQTHLHVQNNIRQKTGMIYVSGSGYHDLISL